MPHESFSSMPWFSAKGALCTCLIFWGVVQGWGGTYYVDFAGGDDKRSGKSEQEAWKHAPGDPQAQDKPASVKLESGDVVQFRGGVVYRGSIVVPAGGTPEAKIVYRGTGWGEGRAVLDGSEPVTGWRKCTSAAEAGGAANFSGLYFAEIKTESPFLLNLHEMNPQNGEDEFLCMAQDPNPADPFFFDRRDSFHPVSKENLTTTSLASPEVLKQTDPDHWKDASILLWVNPNFTRRYPIVSFNPAEHRITFPDIGENSLYKDRDQSFALYNSPHLIDLPGEYSVGEPNAEGLRRIILRPRSPENPEGRISHSVRNRGFDIGGKSHVEIDGFVVRKFAGLSGDSGCGIAATHDGRTGSSGLLIRNNLVSHNMSGERGYGGIYLEKVKDSVVEHNEVVWNKAHRGIFATGGENLIIRRNRIANTGATALGIYTGKRIQILGNELSQIYATHANGITIYIASENVLVAGNRITDATTPITFQDSGPLYFINNVTDGGGQYKNVNEWGNTKRGPWTTGRIVFLNNTFLHAESKSSLSVGKDPEKSYIAINNILDGAGFGEGKAVTALRKNNIYTGLNNFQSSRYNWALGEKETEVADLGKLFIDPDKMDFRPRPGGPAAGAGVDVSEYLPKDIYPEIDFDALFGGVKPRNIGASDGEAGLPKKGR